jgi:hypothetical protein
VDLTIKRDEYIGCRRGLSWATVSVSGIKRALVGSMVTIGVLKLKIASYSRLDTDFLLLSKIYFFSYGINKNNALPGYPGRASKKNF